MSDAEADRINLDSSKQHSLKSYRGRIGGLALYYWDRVRDCSGEACELWDKCPYQKHIERNDKSGFSKRCVVESKYLKRNLDPFLDLLQKVQDKFVMQWIGSHIIPKYADLAIIELEKHKLTSPDYVDGKGIKRIHPLYDQALKTHKAIEDSWKTFNLFEIAKKAGFLGVGPTVPFGGKDLEIEGDGDYYEDLMGDDETK